MIHFPINLSMPVKPEERKDSSSKGGIWGCQEFQKLATKPDRDGNLAGRESPDYPAESP